MKSNRPQHLVAALSAATVITALEAYGPSLIQPGVSLWAMANAPTLVGPINAYFNVVDLPFLGLGVFMWELIATPDVDHPGHKVLASRNPVSFMWKLAWTPYRLLLKATKHLGINDRQHRSKFSHSLVFGTTTRLAYVLAFTLPLFEYLPRLAWLVHIAVLADIVHMVMDGYNPVEIVVGK